MGVSFFYNRGIAVIKMLYFIVERPYKINIRVDNGRFFQLLSKKEELNLVTCELKIKTDNNAF